MKEHCINYKNDTENYTIIKNQYFSWIKSNIFHIDGALIDKVTQNKKWVFTI